MGGLNKCLKEFAQEHGYQKEFRELIKNAQLGLQYRKELEDAVVRLGLALELGAEEPVLRNVVKMAAAEDLMKLKEALEGRLNEMMPLATQLGGYQGQKDNLDSGYLI